MDRGDLANLSAFVTVADQRSFRAAASRLDVTPSALSHSMRQLEARLGVRLLNRTTRSVSVTDAGQRLLEQLRPALGQISDAVEDLNRERSRPFGRLRIYATNMAGAGVIAPVWQRFGDAEPKTGPMGTGAATPAGSPDTRAPRKRPEHPRRPSRTRLPHTPRKREPNSPNKGDPHDRAA
jgi:hypothetical protein